MSLRVGRDIEIRDTARKGRGVFAVRDIAKWDFSRHSSRIIGHYAGGARNLRALLPSDPLTYSIHINGSDRIPKNNDESMRHWTELVNHQCSDRTPSEKRNGTCYCPHGGCVTGPNVWVSSDGCMLPLRNIKRGEELVFDYGRIYWSV